MSENAENWLEKTTGASKRKMALAIGQTPSTFNRNIEKPETVIEVCRAFNINPARGLVATGHLTNNELGDLIGESSLDSFTNGSLLIELLRRENAKGSPSESL